MTAALVVLTEIAKTDLSVEEQAWVAAVVEGETPQISGPGYSPWNILYSGAGELVGTPGLEDQADAANILMERGYRYWVPELTGFPAWSGGRLASGNYSSAAGGPQITRTTWNSNTALGVTTFDPQGQSTFAIKYASALFQRRAGRSLLSALQGTDADRMLVSTYLGTKPYLTWPGGCDAKFPARYAANLAALKAGLAPVSVPAPTPTPDPTLAPETVTMIVTDQAGRTTGPITAQLVATVSSVIVAAGLAGVTMMLAKSPVPAVESSHSVERSEPARLFEPSASGAPRQESPTAVEADSTKNSAKWCDADTFATDGDHHDPEWNHPEKVKSKRPMTSGFDFSGSTFYFDRNGRPVPTTGGR